MFQLHLGSKRNGADDWAVADRSLVDFKPADFISYDDGSNVRALAEGDEFSWAFVGWEVPGLLLREDHEAVGVDVAFVLKDGDDFIFREPGVDFWALDDWGFLDDFLLVFIKLVLQFLPFVIFWSWGEGFDALGSVHKMWTYFVSNFSPSLYNFAVSNASSANFEAFILHSAAV